MRAGLTASTALHASLITLALVGLGHVAPMEPEQIESIAIDLVPVEEFSNIRVGTLDSEIIETETPSAVDTPTPATLAERTGNTQEDQPNPELTDTPTPAPTVQTAPEPEAVEAPDPEPEPTPMPAEQPAPAPRPEPVTDPEPEPQPNPDPVLSTATDTPAEPEVAAPEPVIKTASIDRKREQFAQKKQEEARRRAAEREAEQKAKADEAQRISDIINDEQSRGATTGTGGQATAGKPTGQAARLTRSEQDALAAQMRKCFSPPLGATTVDAARLLVELNRDGTVSGTPRILSVAGTRLGETTARAAQRAVMRCGPYQLAAEKYEDWRQVDVTFDPRDL